MSSISFVLLPSPYMVMESTLVRGAATFLAISGSAFIIISTTAASPYFFMASALRSIPSASARALALIASASAAPTALIPSAICSCSKRLASASCLRAYSSASAFFSAAYLSASAFLRISASNRRSCSVISRSASSASFSRFAMSASVDAISRLRRCFCSSIL